MGQNFSPADVYVCLGEDPFCVTALYTGGAPVTQGGSAVEWMVSLGCVDLQTSKTGKGGSVSGPNSAL